MSKNKGNTLPGFKSSVSANLTVMVLFCSPTWLSSGAEVMPSRKEMPLSVCVTQDGVSFHSVSHLHLSLELLLLSWTSVFHTLNSLQTILTDLMTSVYCRQEMLICFLSQRHLFCVLPSEYLSIRKVKTLLLSIRRM